MSNEAKATDNTLETFVERAGDQRLDDGHRTVGSGLGLTVPIADPFELLRNKLAIRRPKDLPHIELLREYVREFIVDAFGTEGSVRERLGPVRA